VTELIAKAGDAGRGRLQPEVAYFECLRGEADRRPDLRGRLRPDAPVRQRTAKYGDLTRGLRIVDAHVKEEMKKILEKIRSGQFAREWVLENQATRPVYSKLLARDLNHPIEAVGASCARGCRLQPQAAAAARRPPRARNGHGRKKREAQEGQDAVG
jgi:ketol-acid reductoisomerase